MSLWQTIDSLPGRLAGLRTPELERLNTATRRIGTAPNSSDSPLGVLRTHDNVVARSRAELRPSLLDYE